MNYIGGTKAAVDLLTTLDKQGDLISLYPHLLILRLDQHCKPLHSEICAVYPPLKQALNDNPHLPHFLLFNLELKKILCVGLGRKCKLFVFDPQTNLKVPFYGFNGSGSNREINEFLKNDQSFQLYILVTALVRLGHALDDFFSFPCIDPVAAEILLEETYDQDETFEIELDGLRMPRGALMKVVKQYALNDKQVDDAMAEIRRLFPNVEAVDFNPEDF